jgi:hypothetical protein
MYIVLFDYKIIKRYQFMKDTGKSSSIEHPNDASLSTSTQRSKGKRFDVSYSDQRHRQEQAEQEQAEQEQAEQERRQIEERESSRLQEINKPNTLEGLSSEIYDRRTKEMQYLSELITYCEKKMIIDKVPYENLSEHTYRTLQERYDREKKAT